jgi:hypothetical protein
MSKPLDARVIDDSFFLSSALTTYQDRHRLDDNALAAELGLHRGRADAPAPLPPGRRPRADGR